LQKFRELPNEVDFEWLILDFTIPEF